MPLHIGTNFKMEINVQKNRSTIIKLLREHANRKGMDNLIKWLDEKDFFLAPASTKYHLSQEGGLAQHSLNVYNLFNEKCKRYGINISDSSIIICGLFHDVCKVEFYYKKQNEPGYGVIELAPLGHGEKSVIMLQRFIDLTKREMMLIRWHMNMFDVSDTGRMSLKSAIKMYPEIVLLFTADYEASVMLENE